MHHDYSIPTDKSLVTGVPLSGEEAGTLVADDPLLVEQYAIIPLDIMRRSDISQGAKLCYGLLCEYVRRWESVSPVLDCLALDLGVSPSTVSRYMHELADVRLVSIHRRGQGQTNVYAVHRRPPSATAVRLSVPCDLKAGDRP